jgi:hypothetical protein
MRLTVGPLPPAVYWRRRVIVLAGVLLALFLLAQACMSTSASPEQRSNTEPGEATSAPPPTPASPTADLTTAPVPTSAPPATATTGPTGTPADADTCANDEMLITAEAERTTLPGGTNVQFTIRIRNDSGRTCRRDIGGDQRELYLRAADGTRKLWSSRDCDAPTGSDVQELPPSFETKHWLVWKGRASDSCDGDEPAGEPVPPGEYELVARLGTAYGDPLPITIR